MKLERLCVALMLASAAVLANVATASAQVDSTLTPKSGPAMFGGGYLTGSIPQGEWAKTAGWGLGLDGTDIVRPKPASKLSIRSSSGVLYNFSQTVDVPAANVSAGDKLSIKTSNWSITFGIGPEFSIPNKAISPFIFGTAGFDTYWTSSELAGTANGANYSAEHGDSRISFAWGAGVGIRKHSQEGVQMELSAEWRSGSDHQFLRPDDVHSTGAGVVADRQSQTSDQIIIRLGAVLGGAALKAKHKK